MCCIYSAFLEQRRCEKIRLSHFNVNLSFFMDTLKQQLSNLSFWIQPERDLKPVRPTYEDILSCCHFHQVT